MSPWPPGAHGNDLVGLFDVLCDEFFDGLLEFIHGLDRPAQRWFERQHIRIYAKLVSRIVFRSAVPFGQVRQVFIGIADPVASEIQVEPVAFGGAVIIFVYPAVSRRTGFGPGEIVVLVETHIVIALVIQDYAIGMNDQVLAFCFVLLKLGLASGSGGASR